MAKVVDYRIVISECAKRNEIRAAAFLRENIKLVCGKKLDIVKDTEAPSPFEIVVGETNREGLDGLNLERSRSGVWEYTMKSVGDRFYLAGLGTAPENITRSDDGAMGTVMAVYRFIRDMLDYDFIFEAYHEYPEHPELEMPFDFECSYKREILRAQKPKKIEGAAMFSLNVTESIAGGTCGSIFRTRDGKIIVFDGGMPDETGRFLRVLRDVTGADVPHVDAWFWSHVHGDHTGVYEQLCKNPEFKGALTVDTFYCNLCTERFWAEICPERHFGNFVAFRRQMLDENFVIADKVVVVEEGDVIRLDEIEIEVIHTPDEAFGAQMDINDSSVVYKINYDGQQTIMMLGDAEFVCENDLVTNKADKLKSDVVQIGHHGNGNVSSLCYEMIGAKAYIWEINERWFFGESGATLGELNGGMFRSRDYVMRLKPKKENIHWVAHDILSLPLPIPIK